MPPEDSWQLLIDSLPAQVNRPDDPPGDVERMNRVLAVVMDPRADHRCTATELAAMLSAVILGQDPTLPDREAHPLPAPATEGFPSSAWATAHTAPQNTIDPNAIPDTPPTVQPPPSEPVIKEAAEGASTGCVVGGVLAAVLLVVALAGGWVHQNRPDLLGLNTPDTDIPALTGHETEEPAKSDYRVIYESVEALKPWLQEGCSIPEGSEVSLSLVIEDGGLIRAVEVTAGVSDVVDACIASSLPAATVNRGQPGPIRFPKVLTW
ncbi:MAG: hypothetical protein ACI8RZ_006576 [Myxococcota bacterium]